jgi:hypothetical protein
MKANTYFFKKLNVFLVGFCSLLAACQDLSEEPKSFASPETFYNDPGQIEAVFSGTMNTLWGAWYGYGWAMRASFRNTDSQNGGDLNIPENHGSDLWYAHYRAIANLNFALDAIRDGKLGSGVPQEEVELLVGQAKFLRAYNYFMLVRMFGALPLPTEDTPNYFSAFLPRSPVAEVYELIVSDFTEAAQKLPPTCLKRKEEGRRAMSLKGCWPKSMLPWRQHR